MKRSVVQLLLNLYKNPLKKINIVPDLWWWKCILFSHSKFLIRKVMLAVTYLWKNFHNLYIIKALITYLWKNFHNLYIIKALSCFLHWFQEFS